MPQLPPDADFIPDFSKGLVPAIAQDCASGEVLMLAYMNEDAWRKTLETGEAHYWSRSRRELWHKGGTSGNVQKVRALRLDCDNDTVLLLVEQQGGAAGMEKINQKKAQMLYDVLDNAKLFTVSAEKGSRSHMNVTFRSASEEMDAKFVAESVKAGFTNLKGHRSVGGMRASIYNAMPTEGVEKLCDFIQKFDKEN